jgi:hypothetical protein
MLFGSHCYFDVAYAVSLYQGEVSLGRPKVRVQMSGRRVEVVFCKFSLYLVFATCSL